MRYQTILYIIFNMCVLLCVLLLCMCGCVCVYVSYVCVCVGACARVCVCVCVCVITLQIAMPHQWLEGNLPVSAKCAVCDKTCGSVLRLQDWRCLWCKAMVGCMTAGHYLTAILHC